jgi:hypothetical protein
MFVSHKLCFDNATQKSSCHPTYDHEDSGEAAGPPRPVRHPLGGVHPVLAQLPVDPQVHVGQVEKGQRASAEQPGKQD